MIGSTYIARASDGLPLCENSDIDSKNYQFLRRKVNEFLRSEKSKYDTPTDASNFAEIDTNYFHYKIQNGIVYLVVCQDIYPKKLAKVYIEAIEEGFMEELRKKYGSMSVSVDYHSKIETIDEPYHFMKFDNFITRKREEFKNVDAPENHDVLASDLHDLRNMMVENIDLLLNREKALEENTARSQKLKAESGIFKDKAKEVKWRLMLRNYLVYLVIGSVIILVLYLKFF